MHLLVLIGYCLTLFGTGFIICCLVLFVLTNLTICLSCFVSAAVWDQFDQMPGAFLDVVDLSEC